ncbi:MAG: DUF5009 domain-containing protein [Bryobacteraceae bacterium]
MSASTTAPGRILSIDIFRGLTVLVMVFVNDVSGVKGLPWWTYHMPEGVNGMTYVDMVFSAFLFIVGISLPLAIQRRVKMGDSRLSVLQHIVIRSASLIAIGYFLANLHNLDPQLTGIGARIWDVLAMAGIVMAWSVYPKSGPRTQFYRILRGSGFVLLLILAAIFRRRTGAGGAAGLDLGYPEILGLIGFAYLCAGILYLFLPKTFWWMAGAFAALNAMNAASKMGALGSLGNARLYFWPLGDGALASIVMAGVVFSFILFDDRVAGGTVQKFYWSAGLAVVLFAGGMASLPLGVSKNHATPAWCLFSEASSVVILAALYYLVDIRRAAGWAAFVKPAGSNTLLTYLLPWICSTIPAMRFLSAGGAQGAAGGLRACVFTAFILALSAVLTRMRLRMQL